MRIGKIVTWNLQTIPRSPGCWYDHISNNHKSVPLKIESYHGNSINVFNLFTIQNDPVNSEFGFHCVYLTLVSVKDAAKFRLKNNV